MEKLSPFFLCDNYYAGKEGASLLNLDGSPLSNKDKDRLYIADKKEIYVSLILVRKLILIKEAFKRHNIGLVIKDGFRSLELYEIIINMRRSKGLQVEGLISTDRQPHATGLAVDVTLFNLETREGIWNRNQSKDGDGARFLGFYENATDPAGKEFHRIQRLMVETFGMYDMVPGRLNEVWHFELAGINENTTRY